MGFRSFSKDFHFLGAFNCNAGFKNSFNYSSYLMSCSNSWVFISISITFSSLSINALWYAANHFLDCIAFLGFTVAVMLCSNLPESYSDAKKSYSSLCFSLIQYFSNFLHLLLSMSTMSFSEILNVVSCLALMFFISFECMLANLISNGVFWH